jgi:general secretion pathway protein L
MAAIADSTSFKPTAFSRSFARRLGLSGFFAWWGRELSAAMPATLRTSLARRRARPVLAFDGNRATLWRPVQANGELRMTEAVRIALDGDPQSVAAAGRAALAPLASADGASTQVLVAVPPRASLRKTLALPAALEDHLHQSLAYDLDRHTPFKAEELYFDAVIVDRDSARNTLRVDLAAARRSVVDAIVRQAESFGLRVVGVVVDPPAAAAGSRLDLLPEDRRVATGGWTRWEIVVPALLLAVGALAALYLPIWQKREEAIELHRMADQARVRATASDALRSELERRVGEYNFALERKYAFPGVVQVLDDVTRILPDDTWLTQFELRAVRGKDGQRELALRGESANAGRLVSLLEDSQLFTQAAPRSPTTKIQPGPGEIFDVGAQLKPLPKPAALPLDMTPPVQVPPAAAAAVPAAASRKAANGGLAPAAAAPAPPAPAATAAPTAPSANAPSTPAASAASSPATASTSPAGLPPAGGPAAATPPAATTPPAAPASAGPALRPLGQRGLGGRGFFPPPDVPARQPAAAAPSPEPAAPAPPPAAAEPEPAPNDQGEGSGG